jgi:hypothetical protein
MTEAVKESINNAPQVTLIATLGGGMREDAVETFRQDLEAFGLEPLGLVIESGFVCSVLSILLDTYENKLRISVWANILMAEAFANQAESSWIVVPGDSKGIKDRFENQFSSSNWFNKVKSK